MKRARRGFSLLPLTHFLAKGRTPGVKRPVVAFSEGSDTAAQSLRAVGLEERETDLWSVSLGPVVLGQFDAVTLRIHG